MLCISQAIATTSIKLSYLGWNQTWIIYLCIIDVSEMELLLEELE